MTSMNVAGLLYQVSIWVFPVLLAVTFHEAAHGFAAWRLGDPTAYRRGRVTINPLRHVDPFGTILLPGLLLLLGSPFLFGYAKPVPVDYRNLANPRRDMMWIAAAGPAVNVALAYVSALVFHLVPLLPGPFGGWLAQNLFRSVLINLVLAVFNLLPLPPLDGGRIAVGLLPLRLARPFARLERHGLMILVLLIFLLPLLAGQLGLRIDPFQWLVAGPVDVLSDMVFKLAGL
ncbi:MAG: site-2 protease family protein [Proteobacteria bacterium]|nr:site-2 protease family protein [Pseudomonadota bacterium]